MRRRERRPVELDDVRVTHRVHSLGLSPKLLERLAARLALQNPLDCHIYGAAGNPSHLRNLAKTSRTEHVVLAAPCGFQVECHVNCG